MMAPRGLRTFDGGVAIVTGSASGIGLALTEELAARGCEVVLPDLQDDLAEDAAAAMRVRGLRATAVRLDVTDFAQVSPVVRGTIERCGRIDWMFNNAGIGVPARSATTGSRTGTASST